MKIGDFAKACGVPISLLRYYDNQGLLKPTYIDRFTGYRYYDEGQREICKRINRLKACGFSLAQIGQLLNNEGVERKEALFERQQKALEGMLSQLDEIKKDILQENKKWENKMISFQESIEYPFENDEDIIGKWVIVSSEEIPHTKSREVYFLPDGEGYWCYGGWTRGLLFYDDDFNTCANPYTLEHREDGLYMKVNYKSYDYWNGGEPEQVVLKKLDSRHYSRADITIRENTDLPFETDAQVLGKWVAYSYIERKSDFSQEPFCPDMGFYFKSIEFLPGGECISIYGDEVISGEKQSWTKGFVLRHFNQTACAYEIRTVRGKEYLLLEWKSGNYRWGGYELDYYVMVRDNGSYE